MPKRRSGLLVAIVAVGLSAESARSCPIIETEPICAELDERPETARAPREVTLDGGLDRLRTAFAAEPDSTPRVIALAAALDEAGEPNAARRLLERFLVDHAREVEALHALLEIEWTSDRTARAHELALAWRALTPRDPRALLHELVASVTVEPEPDVEGRLAELARSGGDAELGLAACGALSPPRLDRCVTRLVDLFDWRREAPDSRRRLYELLAWRGDSRRALELLAAEDDPALRASALARLARRAAYGGDCTAALALAGGLPGAQEELATIAHLCGPRPDPRPSLLAALAAGDTERALRESWSLGRHRADPELEAAVRTELRANGGDARLWSILERLADDGDRGPVPVWEEWAALRPLDAEPLSRLAANRFDLGDTEGALAALGAALARAGGEERAELAGEWLQRALWDEGRELAAFLARELPPADDETARVATLAAALVARADGRPGEALTLIRSAGAAGDDGGVSDFLERELLAAAGDEAAVVARYAEELDSVPHEQRDAWIARLAHGDGLERLARERYALALADDPGDPGLWASLGELELGGERTAAAIDALRRAVALRPEIESPRSLLARGLGAERRWSEALDILVEHSGAATFLAGDLLDLARRARADDQPFVADEALERAAALDPEAPDVRFELAARSAREGRRGEAAERFAALARLPADAGSECVSDCDLEELLRRARGFVATGLLPDAAIEVAASQSWMDDR